MRAPGSAGEPEEMQDDGAEEMNACGTDGCRWTGVYHSVIPPSRCPHCGAILLEPAPHPPGPCPNVPYPPALPHPWRYYPPPVPPLRLIVTSSDST